MKDIDKPLQETLSGQLCRFFKDEEMMEAYSQRHPGQLARLGQVAIYLFRKFPEQDYVRYRFPKDRQSTIFFDRREEAIWLGGVAISKEDLRILTLANRQSGSFLDQYGWNPSIEIKDEPTEQEREFWVDYETSHVEDEWANFDG